MEPEYIRIRGARMHNLKNINVDLPRNRLVVFTGLSGSGKSSLAFDTLYAEGHRRYVESLSTYARQFLGQMEKPDIDSLEGLSPAISIEQRATGRNPRSTVGTITEIYDHLRLLYARVGRPYCPECGREIRPQSIQDMVENLMARPEKTQIILLAPIVDARKGQHADVLQSLRRDGYVRVRIDGVILNLDDWVGLDKNKRHNIEAVVDRLTIKPSIKRRLSDSVATAVKRSAGFLLVYFPETGEEALFSEQSACIQCGQSLPELSPALFSFNNPKGACTECGGLGVKQFFDPSLVVPDQNLTLRQGALAPWGQRSSSTFSGQILQGLSAHYSFDLDTRCCDLPEKARSIIFNGTGNEEVVFHYEKNHRQLTYRSTFEGILPYLARRYTETSSPAVREDLAQFMNQLPCQKCRGARLKPAALAVRIGPWSICDLTRMSIEDLGDRLLQLEFTPREFLIGEKIIKEIQDRLSFLKDVGLGYLSLDRRASTLSGGEAQRIKLASQIGSRLAGVLYILDEPSIGLHQRDNQRLIHTLSRLRDMGNTVIVVEHDTETILAADHVLDMGPGAGIHGGYVVFNGPVKGLMKDPDSVTGGYLSGRLIINVPNSRRVSSSNVVIHRARLNNLKDITVAFPVGLMTCVTGVSGSGKSSLVIETLLKGASNPARSSGGDFEKIVGLDLIDKVIDIDQSPIGRTPRSNPATYTGVLTPIRELFSKLPESRARGYRPSRFSFNVRGGRCEACEGDGVIKIAMHFLPDIYVTCETCMGRRYNEETLEIRYRGKNIADILGIKVEEALDFFNNVPSVRSRLQTVYDVGLAYLALGQSSVTLSGGEAQRIKLARELSKKSTGRTLYILDEPTTGLHPSDIQYLLNVLGRLVDSGNTVVVIEHNLDVIKTADYVIDLGPEGGDGGGRVVAVGTPEEIANNRNSYTGKYLKQVLG